MTIGFGRMKAIARALHRALVFRTAMRAFRKSTDAFTDPEHPILENLVYGWGNESWSARAEYLAACVDHALRSQGPILECGSGLSTILVGHIAQERGLKYWCLENSAEWAAKVRRYLRRYKIKSINVHVAPLRDYGEFCWYDPPMVELPNEFMLVLCDGPPGATKGGRYGLAPVMQSNMGEGCVILLDDAERDGEAATAKRWQVYLHADVRLLGSAKPYFVVNTGSANTDTYAADDQ